MKNKRNSKVAAPMGFSIILLGIFIIVAVGSSIFGSDNYTEKTTIRSLGNNNYVYTRTDRQDLTEIKKRGERFNGWWEGPVVEEKYQAKTVAGYQTVVWRRETNYVDGLRHGEETFTKYDNEGNVTSTEVICYSKGRRIDCEKSAGITQSSVSAFEIFEYNYPWLLPYYNGYGFSNEYIAMYMDTIEQILETHEIEPDKFEDTYSDILSDLEDNGYDSIININEMYAMYNGLDIMLKNEFRLAVISKLRKQEQSTYNEVENSYANYLSMLNNLEVTNTDFEQFCEVFDSVYTSYGATDVEDPFFSDTVDVRLFRALVEISNSEDSVKSSLLLKSAVEAFKYSSISKKAKTMLNQYMIESNKTPKEVSQVLILLMIMEFSEGDFLKNSVYESFMSKMNVPIPPTVTTSVSGNNTRALKVTGYVLDDGGGEITQRGIAWAEVYNPTINNNSILSGTGEGEFSEPMPDIEDGKMYYARAFASNRAGTAYGNCVSFNSRTGTAIDVKAEGETDFVIYPNPATEIITVHFSKNQIQNASVTISDLNGKVLIQKKFGDFQAGGTPLTLDVSSLENGIYICRLSNNKNAVVASQKIVIAR